MKNIFKIITISKPLHKIVTVIGILILVSTLFDLVTPVFSKYIVDEIVSNIGNHGGSFSKLITLIILTFVLSLLGVILNTISDRLGDHFAGQLRKFLTEKFYNQVLTLPLSYFDSEISGKITNQLSRGINAVGRFINSATNFILPTFLQSILTIILLAFYSPLIAFFVFLLFPIYLYLSYRSAKRWGKFEDQKNSLEDINRGRIQEVISNMKLVKSFNNEYSESKIVAGNLRESNKIYATQSTGFHLYDFFRNFSLVLILLLVNIIAFVDTFNGHISIGTLVLILQLINQARRPLFAMSFILTNIQNAESGSKEFFEVLDLPSKEKFSHKSSAQKETGASIKFEKVSFSYQEGQKVLEDVNFELNHNQTVAIVGHSGAGKSTIINLILKFYEPLGGDISLNNKNYRDLGHGYVRDNIALVFQESELFSTTVRENVAYGNLEATNEQVIQSLQKANAYDFVTALPQGIDSQIGERGVKLSGGQKQRIQMARAILKDAPILILDEATSSLDAKSEKEVQDGLEKLISNRLVIIIAHRFSTIQNADQVLVIDNGKIVDSGSPKELSTRKGIYSDLLRYQVEGNKKLLESFELY